MYTSCSMTGRLLHIFLVLLWIISSVFTFLYTNRNASAQTDEITWKSPVNISNTPDAPSADPILLADPAGIVHLFWADKIGKAPGFSTDTIMYAQWDGENWSKPIDIFFSPLSDGNPIANYPHAILDEKGNIHLIWMSEPNAPNYTLNYSSVHSSKAHIASAWNPSTVLASDLTGTFYAIDIAYQPPQTIHVIYARGALGDALQKERTVSYIRSEDAGESWSEPVDLHIIRDLTRGASHTRLLVESPNKVYASWTEWSTEGLGEAIYFTRSLNGGLNWENPIKLAERAENEYERDWNSLVSLGENQLMAMWEGGYRAYRYAMYSDDGGVTWTDAVDTFPWLIGECGFAEFARDSSGILHLFICQRIREGEFQREDTGGMFHSVWEGNQRWRDPVLSGGGQPMLNPKVAIYNGNRVMTTWFSSIHQEIMVMAGEIGNASSIAPVAWPSPTPDAKPTQTPVNPPVVTGNEIEPVENPTFNLPDPSQAMTMQTNPMNLVLFGLLPTFLVVVVFIVVKERMSKRY